MFKLTTDMSPLVEQTIDYCGSKRGAASTCVYIVNSFISSS